MFALKHDDLLTHLGFDLPYLYSVVNLKANPNPNRGSNHKLNTKHIPSFKLKVNPIANLKPNPNLNTISTPNSNPDLNSNSHFKE